MAIRSKSDVNHMAIRWQSDGNQMAIRCQSDVNPMPTITLTITITICKTTHQLLTPFDRPLGLEMALRVPLHLPLCHRLFVASCRRAIRNTVSGHQEQ
jgi:hypothetical protein